MKCHLFNVFSFLVLAVSIHGAGMFSGFAYQPQVPAALKK